MLWRSSAEFANSPETFEIPVTAKLSTLIRLAPPSGVAAARAINTFGIRETMQQKLPKWTSIALAYQFAKTGKVEPDLVTMSRLAHGWTASQRLVPRETRDPLRQHAVLLEAGSKSRRAFADFPKGPETHAGIARHGSVRQAQS